MEDAFKALGDDKYPFGNFETQSERMDHWSKIGGLEDWTIEH